MPHNSEVFTLLCNGFRLILSLTLVITAIDSNAKSVYELGPVEIRERFENTNDALDSLSVTPEYSSRLNQRRMNLVEDLAFDTPYLIRRGNSPSQNFGLDMGGRTADDTQWIMNGVPLNSSIGGGVDLSMFPSFLFTKTKAQRSIRYSGFTPQAISGSFRLEPWTRSSLLNRKIGQDPISQATLLWDHQIQGGSLGTANKDYALQIGGQTGLQTGVMGSTSIRLHEGSGLRILGHVMGSEVEGWSRAPTGSPTFGGNKKSFRLIPTLETAWEEGLLKIENTTYYQTQNTLFESASGLTDDRANQLGSETTARLGDFLFSYSFRNLSLRQSADFETHPRLHQESAHQIILGYTHRNWIPVLQTLFTKNHNAILGGRLGYRDDFLFAEASSVGRVGSFQDRFYVSPYFQGNPNLLPERVHALQFGLNQQKGRYQFTHQIRMEKRSNAQLLSSDYSTVTNQGSAHQFLLDSRNEFKITSALSYVFHGVGQISRVEKTQSHFPNVPRFSINQIIHYQFTDAFSIHQSHRFLQDAWNLKDTRTLYWVSDVYAQFAITEGANLQAGISDLFDARPELQNGFPTEGRTAYLSLALQF